MKPRGTVRASGIGRNVILVGCVSLFTDLSSQMVFPLIPLFMASVLSAPAFAIGLIEGAAESIAALLKVVSGVWSDRVRRRKPFLLAGYTFSGFVKPLFAFASSWPQVLLIRAVERMGKGLRNAPRDALVAESCKPDQLGRAFGLQRAMDGVGSVIGALTGAALMVFLQGSVEEVYRQIFLLSLLPAALATLAILAIKETAPLETLGSQELQRVAERVVECAAERPGQHFSRLRLRDLPPRLRLFMVASSVFALGHFGYAFLLLRARDVGLSDTRAIVLYAGFYLVYAAASMPLGALSDRVGRKAYLIAGYSLFAATSIVLFFASSLVGVIVAFAIYGVSYAIVDGGQKAFVVDLCPPHLKATALGAFYTSIGLFAMPGGFIAGLLWEAVNPQATFLYGCFLAAIAVWLVVRIDTRTHA
ncbi:MAG: MFS transporter [Acidobacteriota bacterium]